MTGRTDVVRRFAVCLGLAALVTALLAGCGRAPSHSSSGYLGGDAGTVAFLRWTQNGRGLSGSLAIAADPNGGVQSKTLRFSGAISGSHVTLNFPDYFGTAVTGRGTLSGPHLRLTLATSTGTSPEFDLTRATVAGYNAAVTALVQKQPLEVNASGQSGLSQEDAVREGIHSLQVGIQCYAVDHNDTYPTVATQASLIDNYGKSYIDVWPTNPYTGTPMALGTGAGDYSYSTNGMSYQLIGYGNDLVQLITVP